MWFYHCYSCLSLKTTNARRLPAINMAFEKTRHEEPDINMLLFGLWKTYESALMDYHIQMRAAMNESFEYHPLGCEQTMILQ